MLCSSSMVLDVTGLESMQAQAASGNESAAKQWLDTLDKALRGWTAYLQVMLPHVTHLACFEPDWHRLVHMLGELITMRHLEDTSGSRKVQAASRRASIPSWHAVVFFGCQCVCCRACSS